MALASWYPALTFELGVCLANALLAGSSNLGDSRTSLLSPLHKSYILT